MASSHWVAVPATPSRPRSCARTSHAPCISHGPSALPSRSLERKSTRSMTATTTSTASAEQVAAARPRVGVLGIMQELYDEMLPGITERQGEYAQQLGAMLGDALDVTVAPPARNRAEI